MHISRTARETRTEQTDDGRRRPVTRAGGLLALAAAGAMVLAGCTDAGSPAEEPDAGSPAEEPGAEPGSAEQDTAQPEAATDPVELTIGLTYIPDVQFAPFYLAQEAGYFDEESLEVELRHHGASESLFGAFEAGEEDVVVSGNDEIVQAVSHGTDVRSIATMYQDYPVQIFVPEDSDIEEVSDLAGRSLGIPGPFGQSWFGLLGYLDQAGLDQDEVQIEHVGFTLFNALSEGHVDAVTGFVTADTAAFAIGEFPVRTIADSQALPLVSVGLGASDEWLAQHPEAATGVINAVGRAVDDIRSDPQQAVGAAGEHIPGTMTDDDEAAALLTAEAMVELYGTAEFGTQDPGAWEEMAEFMDQMELLDRPVSADEAYTSEFTHEQ